MSVQSLELNLYLRRSPAALGQRVDIGVEVSNRTKTAVWMLGVLDGSEAGVRFPKYAPRISGPMSIDTRLEAPEFTSPLRADDFCLLQPGEGFDPTRPRGKAAYLPLVTFERFIPTVPGTYKLSLMLSTMSEHDQQWLGTLPDPHQAAFLSKIAQIPRCRVLSNELVFQV